MAITFRNYKPTGFTGDYMKVWHMLRDIDDEPSNPYTISWVRWEWCRSHSYFDRSNEHLTGLWEDNGQVVAAVCYETVPGDAFFNLRKGYEYLLDTMFDYAEKTLAKEGVLKIAVPDDGHELQVLAQEKGYVATGDKESDAYLTIEHTELTYTLPDGFTLTSLVDDYDLKKYASVLWHGFDHGSEGPTPTDEKSLAGRALSLAGPHNDLSLKIAVKNPQGDFVSYAGLWYDRQQDYCTIEPCATHPDYRRMGLGKAAIYEGINRCGSLGAKYGVVGSDQDFYYLIGFAPRIHLTYWKKK